MEGLNQATKANILSDKYRVRFKASLSNGEVFFEGKTPLEWIEGEREPFSRLINYSTSIGSTITSLGLFTLDGRTYNLPSSGKDPKFLRMIPEYKTFMEAIAPIDYQVERKAKMTVMVKRPEVKKAVIDPGNFHLDFTVAKAIYPDYALEVWVSETDPRNSWTIVVPNINKIK